jgi:hypothetical protein
VEFVAKSPSVHFKEISHSNDFEVEIWIMLGSPSTKTLLCYMFFATKRNGILTPTAGQAKDNHVRIYFSIQPPLCPPAVSTPSFSSKKAPFLHKVDWS